MTYMLSASCNRHHSVTHCNNNTLMTWQWCTLHMVSNTSVAFRPPHKYCDWQS